MIWVAATGFTASSLTVVPVVGSTLVAVVTFDVSPAGTGSCPPVAVALPVPALVRLGPRQHTGTA